MCSKFVYTFSIAAVYSTVWYQVMNDRYICEHEVNSCADIQKVHIFYVFAIYTYLQLFIIHCPVHDRGWLVTEKFQVGLQAWLHVMLEFSIQVLL